MLAFSAAAAAALAPTTASAQNLFDFLFGGRRHGPPPSASAYADPSPRFNRPRRADPEQRMVSSGGGSGVYCVRLCDGRYFPIPRSGGASAAQICNAFCPASETKVFSSGSGMEHAVASDGTRYASLRNAFAFRQRVVENCTCNGRNPYGLATLDVASDPTLRPGDIVATNNGFVAYNGGGRRHAEFTPIDSYPGVSGELRERLSQTRIMSNNATPVSAEAIRNSRAAVQDDRHAQLDR